MPATIFRRASHGLRPLGRGDVSSAPYVWLYIGASTVPLGRPTS